MDRPPQGLGFRDPPAMGHFLERLDRFDIERVGALDFRYGHTLIIWPYSTGGCRPPRLLPIPGDAASPGGNPWSRRRFGNNRARSRIIPLMTPQSPTRGLLIGLAVTLLAVALFSWHALTQVDGLRQLQTETIDRNRRDSLQLLRIQGNLNNLGLSMRDMLEGRFALSDRGLPRGVRPRTVRPQRRAARWRRRSRRPRAAPASRPSCRIRSCNSGRLPSACSPWRKTARTSRRAS